MKGGYVAKVRVMPADVMTCIDLVNKAGIHTQGMSLSQAISLAIKGLCQGARNTGLVPTRDGFEYEQMTSAFTLQNKAKKLGITALAEQEMHRREAFDLPPPGEKLANMTFNPARRAELEARAAELRFKREHDEINFTEEDMAELRRIGDELIPT